MLETGGKQVVSCVEDDTRELNPHLFIEQSKYVMSTILNN